MRWRRSGHGPRAGAPELGPNHLRLAVPDDAAPGSPASLLVLVPGWRESLRINGRSVDGGFEVGEAFVHCAKAVLRSELWREAPAARTGGAAVGAGPLDDPARAFLAHSPFLAVTSADADGGADASPKGDPAGFVHVLDDGTLAIPDRPGNRRTDTLHNVLDRPDVGIVALVPGDDRTLEISGTARPVRDAALLATLAVRDRVPKAALVVDVRHWRLAPSPALRASRLWDTAGHVPADRLPAASRIWADHVRAGRTPGLAARALRAAAAEPLLRAGVELDYRTNLY